MPYMLDNATDLYNLTSRLRKAYSDSGERVILTPRLHHEDSPKIGFSHLGGCHLETAFKKAGITPPLPKKDFSYHVMDRGNYTSPMFVEPFVWEAQHSLDFGVMYEEYAETDKGHGYADMIVRFRDQYNDPYRAIVEVKDSEGKDGSLGTPKLNYCLQLIGYAMATECYKRLFILINSKRGFETYQLKLVGERYDWFGYQLFDRWGNVFQPDYGEQWNDPQTLNSTTVLTELGSIERLISKVHAWDIANDDMLTVPGLAEGRWNDLMKEVPHQNPLDNYGSGGWRCVSRLVPTKEGRKTKDDEPGLAQYNCQFAKFCHGIGPDKFEYLAKDSEGNYIMPKDIAVKGSGQ